MARQGVLWWRRVFDRVAHSTVERVEVAGDSNPETVRESHGTSHGGVVVPGVASHCGLHGAPTLPFVATYLSYVLSWLLIVKACGNSIGTFVVFV